MTRVGMPRGPNRLSEGKCPSPVKVWIFIILCAVASWGAIIGYAYSRGFR